MLLIALALQTAAPSADVTVQAPLKGNVLTPATMMVEPAAMLIASFDADGDGRTTRAEMEAGLHRTFAASDAAKTGGLRYLAYADWAKRWLGDANALPSPLEVDRNGDDTITDAELQAQFSRLFARLDADHDGAVTRAECLTIRARPAGDERRGKPARDGRGGGDRPDGPPPTP